jgi:hypothetical protein
MENFGAVDEHLFNISRKRKTDSDAVITLYSTAPKLRTELEAKCIDDSFVNSKSHSSPENVGL